MGRLDWERTAGVSRQYGEWRGRGGRAGSRGACPRTLNRYAARSVSDDDDDDGIRDYASVY